MTFLGCGSFTAAIELPPPPPPNWSFHWFSIFLFEISDYFALTAEMLVIRLADQVECPDEDGRSNFGENFLIFPHRGHLWPGECVALRWFCCSRKRCTTRVTPAHQLTDSHSFRQILPRFAVRMKFISRKCHQNSSVANEWDLTGHELLSRLLRHQKFKWSGIMKFWNIFPSPTFSAAFQHFFKKKHSMNELGGLRGNSDDFVHFKCDVRHWNWLWMAATGYERVAALMTHIQRLNGSDAGPGIDSGWESFSFIAPHDPIHWAGFQRCDRSASRYLHSPQLSLSAPSISASFRDLSEYAVSPPAFVS